MIHALDRLEHVEELLPEICTLDCGSQTGDSPQSNCIAAAI